ncbi:MAG: efflux transporter outer membrane subunit [Steroidobacteraceae bacterium]
MTSRASYFCLRSRGSLAGSVLRSAVIGFAGCGLVACSLGPHYKRPEIPPPPAWRDVAGATASAWPSSDWWQGFKSTTLNDLMGQAQVANDDIAAAIARIRQADAQARIAGAALLPSLSLDGDGSRARARQTVIAPAAQLGSGPATFNSFAAQLSASYEVDFWGKNRALRDAARMAAVASRYDRATIELTVMTSVASTYFQALELRDRLKVAQDNVASARDTLKGLRLEAQVGTITALDVAQQETTVATLDAAIPPLNQQLGETLDALATLVGKQPEALEVTPGTLVDLAEPQVTPGMPSELLARRPDVAAAEAQLIAANANLAAARAAFFPSIDLTAAGGYASTALNTLFNPVNRVFTISGALTQPIFQGGALVGQYQLNRGRYAELLADYHKAVIAAFGNVEDALVSVQQTAEQLQRQQQAVATARYAYELTQAQFHAGTINILIVLSTETALFTAEDTLVQVKYFHLNALVALCSALGGGWQRT